LTRPSTGLILTGGGARAAYQVGVLQAVAQIKRDAGVNGNPFDIIAGTSAGAINAASLAGPFAAGEKASPRACSTTAPSGSCFNLDPAVDRSRGAERRECAAGSLPASASNAASGLKRQTSGCEAL